MLPAISRAASSSREVHAPGRVTSDALEEDIYHGKDAGGPCAAHVAVAGDTGERREGIHQASDVGGGGVVTNPTEQVPYGGLREPGEDGSVEERGEAGQVGGLCEVAYARGGGGLHGVAPDVGFDQGQGELGTPL